MTTPIVKLPPDLSPDQLEERIAELLATARTLATVPISSFRVGAVAISDGTAYLGANQEIASLPLNFTVHAEQAAIINARASGARAIQRLVVSAAPCGACRQFLTELRAPLIVTYGGVTQDLANLIPDGFTLGESGGLLAPTPSAPKTNADPLTAAAQRAAAASYSPYTGTKSGIALACASGATYAGSLIESAAYNPTLCALQVALALKNLAGDETSVAAIALCEKGPTPLAPVLPALLAGLRWSPEIHVTPYP